MTFLESTQIEIVSPRPCAKTARAVLFDFDGTVSLIRSGWETVMIPMMVEILAALKTGERETELTTCVNEFVLRLTGKQTIYQMIELADQVRRRGGTSREPLDYKRMYHVGLWDRIGALVEVLRRGWLDPDTFCVPGVRETLAQLRGRGLRLYLASGTDEAFMAEEVRLLGVDRYFDGAIRGAVEDYKLFSKRLLIRQMIEEMALAPGQLLAFGDGSVEIEDTKEAGGIAVAVATDEPECQVANEWKRARLIGARRCCDSELSRIRSATRLSVSPPGETARRRSGRVTLRQGLRRWRRS